jgi:hypothetical protein
MQHYTSLREQWLERVLFHLAAIRCQIERSLTLDNENKSTHFSDGRSRQNAVAG